MQAKYEAQARISWGDPPREVLIYLMGQGFSREDASDMVEEMFRERQATIRRKGIMNILCGISLICVPLIAFVYFLIVGYILVKSFLFTIAIGLGGVWLVIKGASMVVAPKSEQGDVAEQ